MAIKHDSLELGVNGQVWGSGAVGGEDGEAGQLGDRGLAEVKNSWTLWCWRT